MAHPEYILPDNVPAMEFLNLEGHKLSTSRNYAVWLNDYLEKFSADSLRYVLAGNMPESRDTDFSWKDFQARHNNELADILGNFINRTITFSKKYFEGKVPPLGKTDEQDEQFLKSLREAPAKLGELIENYQFKNYIREAMNLAREANKYFNDKEPWKTRKSDLDACATTIHICLQTVYNLSVLFEPVIPFSGRDIREMLNLEDTLHWSECSELNLKTGHQLGEAKILFTKIEDDAINAEIERLQKTLDAMKKELEEAENDSPEEEQLIDIEQFQRIKLKVAKIIEAEKVKKSDKLLKLKVDLGKERRQIIAGIARHFEPQDLIGKHVIVAANLKPAKLRGELSEGMILAAQHNEQLTLLTVLDDIPAGSAVS
jgi:methionyl-tRNA synthetase